MNIDEKLLIDLHHVKRLSLTCIAKKLGCDRSVVTRNLKLHGIELLNFQKITLTKDDLLELHINKGLSIAEISKKMKTSFGVIKRNLIKYGIDVKYNSRLDVTEQELIDLQMGGMTLNDIKRHCY